MDEIAPSWVIVETRISCEEVVERALRSSGYRVYLPRYRRLIVPHGTQRRSATSMRPLFARLVFCQDWRGWPDPPCSSALALMKVGPGIARLSDEDLGLVMARERAGEFDDVHYGSTRRIRDDIAPGDEVEIEVLGRRVLGVLRELSANGKAVVSAMLFDRTVRTEVDAETLRKVSGGG